MSAALLASMGGGAVLGGVGGYFSSQASIDSLNSQLDYLKSLSPQLQEQYREEIKQIENILEKRVTDAGGSGAVQEYYELSKGYNPEDYSYTPTDFAYTSGINDFQDPAAEYRMNAARNARQSSLAAQGNLFGGGSQRQLEAEAQDLASQEWEKSYARMTQDKQSAYQQYRDKVSDTRNSLSQREQGYLAKVGLAGNAKDDILKAEDLAAQRQLDALKQYQQNSLDLSQSTAGVKAQRDSISTVGNVIQGAITGASAGSNIYGAIKK
jgi:hypothetical protein